MVSLVKQVQSALVVQPDSQDYRVVVAELVQPDRLVRLGQQDLRAGMGELAPQEQEVLKGQLG